MNKGNTITLITAALVFAPALASQDEGTTGDIGAKEKAASKAVHKAAHECDKVHLQKQLFLKKHPMLRKEIMTAADANGDGKLTGEEVDAARKLLKARYTAFLEEQKPKRFDRLDKNDDGKLSGEELRRGRRIHDRLDKNDDGKVDAKERQRAAEIHERMDKNDDGKVEPKERRRAQARRSSR